MQKMSTKYKKSAKTHIIQAIKIINYYLDIVFFSSIVIYTNWAKIVLNDYLSSLGLPLKTIGLCYYPNLVQKKEKNHIENSQNIYDNA